jgi:hypothetical protein
LPGLGVARRLRQPFLDQRLRALFQCERGITVHVVTPLRPRAPSIEASLYKEAYGAPAAAASAKGRILGIVFQELAGVGQP